MPPAAEAEEAAAAAAAAEVALVALRPPGEFGRDPCGEREDDAEEDSAAVVPDAEIEDTSSMSDAAGVGRTTVTGLLGSVAF